MRKLGNEVTTPRAKSLAPLILARSGINLESKLFEKAKQNL